MAAGVLPHARRFALLTSGPSKSEFGRSDPPRRWTEEVKEATMNRNNPLLARIPSESEGLFALRQRPVGCGTAREPRLFKA